MKKLLGTNRGSDSDVSPVASCLVPWLLLRGGELGTTCVERLPLAKKVAYDRNTRNIEHRKI